MRRIVLSTFIAFVFGCASHSTAVPPMGSGGVGATGSAGAAYARPNTLGTWTTFSLGSNTVQGGQSIAAGFDGAMWICDNASVDRVDTSGNVTSVAVPSCSDITRDPNGKLYFKDLTNPFQIGRINNLGQVSYVALNDHLVIGPMAADSTGALWTKGGADIAKVDPKRGTVASKNLAFPPGGVSGVVDNFVEGSDSRMWFNCYTSTSQCLGVISLDLSSYTIWLLPEVSNPIAGSDGGIWFSEGTAIARMDPATETLTTYPLKTTIHAACFLENTIQCSSGSATSTGQIAFITKARTLVIYNIHNHSVTIRSSLPNDSDSQAADLVTGVDHNLWTQGGVTCFGCNGNSLDDFAVH